MWTTAFDRWWDEWFADALLRVKSFLGYYSVLKGAAERYAVLALAAVRVELGIYRQKAKDGSSVHQRYFPDDDEDGRVFGRWLHNRSRLEALRLVLAPETVERALLTLPGEQQQILHWRYVDQFPDAEVARMLKIAATGPDLLNVAAGRERSLDAYGALCREIDRLLPQKDSRVGLGSLDLVSVFPLFPGGRRGDLRPGR